MPFRRILVLQSVEDKITTRRKRVIEGNPELQEFEFAFCYAVELTAEQRVMPVREMVEAVSEQLLDADELEERLAREITVFKPDLLIVHPGFVFRVFRHQVHVALRTMRARFPALKIGTPDVHRLPHVRSPFDEGEVLAIAERIFWFERNRWRATNRGERFSLN